LESSADWQAIKLAQSTLSLLVTGFAANHANHALSTHDLALAADFLDRCLNTHVVLLYQQFTWRGKRAG
jgi:hypothetical protein